jgi:hypothetical protein
MREGKDEGGRMKVERRTITVALLSTKSKYRLIRNLFNMPEGILCCMDCACCGCAHLDCDIRDKCSECRPMVLLFCSEFEPTDGGAVAI